MLLCFTTLSVATNLSMLRKEGSVGCFGISGCYEIRGQRIGGTDSERELDTKAVMKRPIMSSPLKESLSSRAFSQH